MSSAAVVEAHTATVSDYVGALRRNKGKLLGSALLILLLSMAVAFGLPGIYRSTATILIEQQDIPQDLVRSTVTSYANQRLQLISQRVMTSANLTKVIQKHNLYADYREREPIESTVDRMVEDIIMETVSAEVIDPKSGRPTEATIAFTLSYDSRSPQLAQAVANELTSLYLNENLKNRTKMAADASVFLSKEAEKLREKILVLERDLADFKERNAGKLPELVELNLQLMERTEREMVEVERQIRSLAERDIYLQSELAQVSPTATIIAEGGERILSPDDQLKVLQAKYASMSAVYSPEHPDIIKLRREIKALAGQASGSDVGAELERQLGSLQAELAQAREKYSSDHPDVKKLERAVANLEKEVSALPPPTAKPTVVSRPDNPAYIQLQAQREAANADLRAMRIKADELRKKLSLYEERITSTPQVEREYRSMSRDYENAVAKYQEIKAKQMEAQLAESLETGRQGERFTLVEPPQLPEDPERPNRIALMFLGLVLSLAGGFGSVAVAESLDETVRGRKGVTELIGAPPLATIPRIDTRVDVWQRLGHRTLAAGLLAAGVGLTVLMAHLFVMPLDVAWFAALRKVGL